jgi:hypothetical protein
MTRLSVTGSRPEFLPLHAPTRARTRRVVRPLMLDRPRIAARALAFGLEDRNDRKFGDTRGL